MSDNSYYTTKDSFIFSFNNNRTDNYILSRVMDENYAIRNRKYYGPSFGKSDLEIWNFTVNYCKKASYEKPIRDSEDYFISDECEVFQIVGD
ncbi:hypothetical protein RclHR1_04670012 [Rhizophagus clarus]|uniref:TLDc domain-containing protein n=1 Tax=Rhizophagus clarus TaxID=94130 RepID=A0A2Z6RJW6_9GLOM|nr:hypothetical protein RclHR1_04670012 [Rhizophagus clarus]